MELGPVSGARRRRSSTASPARPAASDLRFAPDVGRAEVRRTAATRRRSRRRAARSPSSTCARSRRNAPAAVGDARRRASPSARAAARRSSSTPTCTPRNARSAPRRSSPTPASSRQIKPQAQLPFLLSEAQARDGDERLARPALVRADRPQGSTPAPSGAMQGMYVPYWTYDAETRTDYTGQRGTVYYETRPVTRGRQRPPRRRRCSRSPASAGRRRAAGWRATSTTCSSSGSKSLPKRFTDALAPWDLSVLTRLRAEVSRRLPRRGLHGAGRGRLRRGAGRS